MFILYKPFYVSIKIPLFTIFIQLFFISFLYVNYYNVHTITKNYFTLLRGPAIRFSKNLSIN